MNTDQAELARRKEVAISAIRSAFGTEGDEYGVTLFVNHHLEEIEEEYWQNQLAKSKPELEDVIGLLTLRSHWSADDENGIDIFDFTLPDDITNYVISVEFDEAGRVIEITTES